jgi:preprotein translocase subunit SecY
MTIDGRIFYFISAAIIRQLLDVIKILKMRKGRKGIKD